MPDMLVKLYDLPPLAPAITHVEDQGITIRRPATWEKSAVLAWVTEAFSARWALECEASYHPVPASCFIAVKENRIIGFAAYDCTARNFFGPTGVAEEARGSGIGKALLLACLHAMRDDGYGYAIIGGVGPAAFYHKAAGATIIEGSTPGIYADDITSA